MLVEVSGFVCPKVKNDIIKAVRFYSVILIPKHIRNEIAIYVDRTPDHELHGETFSDDDENRTFTISIRDGCEDDSIYQTIAHEMVHVKQWSTGILKHIWSDEVSKYIEYWNGVPWRASLYQHPYFDSPWEIQSYGQEAGLYWRWKQFQLGLPWR